jgi:hypothetical protein
MPAFRILVLFAALLSTACASVQVHGVVRDEQGDPVPGAVATVRDTATGAVVATGASNANGCLDLFELVKGRPESFTLRVEAPGYREAVFPFPRREEPTLLVTLTPAAGTEESTVRPIPWDEREATYRLYCVSAVPPGAGMLGVR